MPMRIPMMNPRRFSATGPLPHHAVGSLLSPIAVVLVALVLVVYGCAGGRGSEGSDGGAALAAGSQPGAWCSEPGVEAECRGDLGLVCVLNGEEKACDCPLSMDFDFALGHCANLEMGQRTGDRCGPSGEGDLPYATCDMNRGLRCVKPDPGELDAPATCQCAPGQEFSARKRACFGVRFGERPGAARPPGPVPRPSSWARCNLQRGLIPSPGPDASFDGGQECTCAEGRWSERRLRCVAGDSICDSDSTP